MYEEIKLVLKHWAINKLLVNFKKTNCMLITSSKRKEHLNIHNIERKTQIQHVNN